MDLNLTDKDVKNLKIIIDRLLKSIVSTTNLNLDTTTFLTDNSNFLTKDQIQTLINLIKSLFTQEEIDKLIKNNDFLRIFGFDKELKD